MPKRSFDSDESDDGKRFRGGFGDDPNSQLDAMLAAEQMGVLGPNGTGTGFGNSAFGGELMCGTNGVSMPSKPEVETQQLDFSRISSQDRPVKNVSVPKELCELLMTTENRHVLSEETGADVEWSPETRQVQLQGSAEQVKKAERLLQRVTTHCHWGRSETKVKRLLKPRIVESVRIVLSPMNTLKQAEKVLSMSNNTLKIGKDKANDSVIADVAISRVHCALELDSERGSVYILDCSTNGTYLNGRRLPSKSSGKVLLSHGDEILLKDPGAGDPEFGFIVNIQELHVKAEVKLEAPRRLLSGDEISGWCPLF